jgi:CheY-like chemotaxis protein
MNSILGFSKMLINEETDPHKRNKLEIILKAGNNLLTLFDEMIQFAKLELDSQPSMISSSMTKVPQSRAAPIRPLPLNSTEGFRLLIAEDNEMNQVLFQELAEELGFNCLVVENGQIALEQLRQAKYDVVLLDINMPVMDGMETIREIRHDENLKDLFVIALTGLALEDDKTICLEAGYDDYIAKPIRVEEFQAKIQQALVLQHPGMEASPLFSSLFTPPPLQVKEDEWPEIILSPDQRGIFLELIEQIRLNLKIFSPQKITALANKLEAHEELPLLGVIRKSLRNAAEEFDETILRDLIKRLERLI